MGCGASTPVSGPLPQVAEAGKPSDARETSNSAPAAIAEDVQVHQDQKPNELKGVRVDVTQDVGSLTPGPSVPSIQPARPPEAEEPVVPEPTADDPPQLPALLAPEAAAADERAADVQQLSPSPQAETQLPVQPQLETDEVQPLGDAGDEMTRLVLGSQSEAELERPQSEPPQTPAAALDPAVTPTSQTATVTLLSEAPAVVHRSRYTNESELSMASTSYDLSGRGEDSDDDDLDSLFTLQAWKRYYGYNKNKHQDLLTYFWRRFPPKDYSCFCISYRDQDLLLTAYMADNCVNGFVARVEDLGLAELVFLQMYVLHDYKADQYRIVGLLLVQGQALPPQLAALSAFDGFVYHKADTSVTLIKQFVSALLVGRSPLKGLQLLSGKEVA